MMWWWPSDSAVASATSSRTFSFVGVVLILQSVLSTRYAQ
jgi:hypothetical protein